MPCSMYVCSVGTLQSHIFQTVFKRTIVFLNVAVHHSCCIIKLILAFDFRQSRLARQKATEYCPVACKDWKNFRYIICLWQENLQIPYAVKKSREILISWIKSL